jgi:hypothetical protein
MPIKEPSDEEPRRPEEPPEQQERPPEHAGAEREQPAPEPSVARVRGGEWGFLAIALACCLAAGLDERSR